MTQLLKKLNEVMEKDKERELDGGKTESADEEKDELDEVRKVRKAEEQVAYLSELFEIYISDNIMLEYPNLFLVNRLSYREVHERQEIFGTLRPSAEHRVVQVTFKASHELYVRFSAVILSREFEVVAYFCQKGKEAGRSHKPLELAKFRDGPGVDWRGAFESVFLAFLGWYEKL